MLIENNGYQLGNEMTKIQLLWNILKHLECMSGNEVVQCEQIRNNGAIWEEFITRRTWQRFQLQKQWNVAVLPFYTKEFHKFKQSVHLTEVLVKITLTTTKKQNKNKHQIINIQVQLIWGQRNCDFLFFFFFVKILQDRHHLRPTNFTAWMFTHCTNVCNSWKHSATM